MSSLSLVLSAIVVLGVSGLPACFFSSRSKYAQYITTSLLIAGAITGIASVLLSVNSHEPVVLTHKWMLPIGAFSIKLDALSSVFLLPVFIVPAIGALYGTGYWRQIDHSENGQRLGAFYGFLAAGMALVIIANDSVLFLFAWEIMALAAFFTSTVEDGDKQVRQSGWIYLIATHIGTLILFGMFAMWRYQTGSFLFISCQTMGAQVAGWIFMLAIIGFGFKAGIFPLHVWLPGAHANAPSHVSAVMSGVMLKTGVYGIIRMSSLLPCTDIWWGEMLIITGALTAVFGITFAIGQQDIKRILAYSSIENIGIIMLGIGLMLTGRYYGRVDLVIFGLCGALLHVWNHSLFKPLLFYNAGALIHALHSRDIESMGGLGKRMPFTMSFFITGAIAITALPPLNGFISEWLIYVGFFHLLDIKGLQLFTIVPVGVIALAVAGPLAIVCFVKVFGTVFLGNNRTLAAEHAEEPSRVMLVSMLLPAIGCILISLFPKYPMEFLAGSVKCVFPGENCFISDDIYRSLFSIAFVSAALIGSVGVFLFIYRKKLWISSEKKIGTWDCGYARPTKQMQYSGSSIGDTVVQLFRYILFPVKHNPDITGKFPLKASYRSVVSDVVLDRLVLPLSRRAGNLMMKSRVFQIGQIHLYVLYIVLIIVILFIIGR